MIRPVTCVGFVLACWSGLYLYQTKHKVVLLDHQIEKTVHATESAREQIRLLHAEWTLLNQPDRLQQLADQFLTLRPTNPAQYTSMAELDHRLPPIPPEPAPEVPPVVMADASAAAHPADVTAAARPADAASAPRAAEKPAEIRPAPAREVASRAPEPVRHKPVEPPAEPRARPRPPIELAAAPRGPAPLPHPPVIQAAAPRPYWAPSRQAYPAQPAYAPAAYTRSPSGSMLGMAHDRAGATPPPAPIPVAAGGG